MTAVEQELLSALRELQHAVLRMRTATPKPDLLPIFTRLDELAANLPREADATLQHYLQHKSYEKARLFLEGRDTEKTTGACRH